MVRPFVREFVFEFGQPLLKKNIVEVMLGPKADDKTKVRVRTFLDENQLSHVPVTAASARHRGDEAKEAINEMPVPTR